MRWHVACTLAPASRSTKSLVLAVHTLQTLREGCNANDTGVHSDNRRTVSRLSLPDTRQPSSGHNKQDSMAAERRGSDKLGLLLSPLLRLVQLLLLALLVWLGVHPAPVLLDQVYQLVAAGVVGNASPHHLQASGAGLLRGGGAARRASGLLHVLPRPRRHAGAGAPVRGSGTCAAEADWRRRLQPEA